MYDITFPTLPAGISNKSYKEIFVHVAKELVMNLDEIVETNYGTFDFSSS